MAYEPQTWSDFNKGFPVSAARMSHLESGISDEESRALAAEHANETAISTEKTRAEGSETTLHNSITNEVSRAEGAEEVNTSAIATEKSRAEAAEGSGKTEVSAEKSRAQTAEGNLATSVTAEKTRAEAGESAARAAAEGASIPLSQKGAASGVATLEASGRVPSSQLPPVEVAATVTVETEAEMIALTPTKTTFVIVSSLPKTFIWKGTKTKTIADWEEFKFSTGVDEVNGLKGASITLTYSTVGADKAGSATTAKGEAEAAAKAEVSAEKTRATAAESTNATSISNEKTRAEGAESGLSSSIAAEKSRAEGKESTLSSSIASEKSRAEGAEGTLTTNLATEKTARETGDTTNASSITGEKNRAEGKEATIEGQVTSERTRAEGKENEAVKLTGAQTVAGVKTFSSSPVVPAASTAKQAATLEQITEEKTRAEAAELLKAPITSPSFLGTPEAITPGSSDNSKRLATTAFVDTAVAAVTPGPETIIGSEIKAEAINEAKLAAVLLAKVNNAVESTISPLANVTGVFKPNLNEGYVFPRTSTGAVEIGSPTNLPSYAANKAIYIEIPIFGEHSIKVPIVASGNWIGGLGEPEWKLKNSSSLNVIVLVTWNGGTTWYGVGGEELPAGTVVATGTPSTGWVPTWNGTKTAWAAQAGGTTSKEVEEAIAKFAFPAGTQPIVLTGAEHYPSEEKVPIGRGSEGGSQRIEWVSLPLEIEGRATVRQKFHKISTAETLNGEPNALYVLEGAGTVFKFPIGIGITPHGQLLAVKNASGGTVTLKGKFTLSSPATETSELLTTPVTIVYIQNQEEVWIPWASYRAQSTFEIGDANTVAMGLSAQSFDQPTAGAKPEKEKVYLAKVMVPFNTTFKEIYAEVLTGGIGFTSVARFGIYGSEGKLLGQTKDEKVALESTGSVKMKLESSTTVIGGPGVFVWISILMVATSTPELACSAAFSSSKRMINAALIAETVRAGIGQNSAKEEKFTAFPELVPANNLGKSTDVPFFWLGAK